jgi:hypothetical protein
MKPYLITYKFYYGDELKRTRTNIQLCEKSYAAEYSGIGFEGLWDLADEWQSMIPYEKLTTKKGKRSLWDYDKIFSRITEKNCKPWKFVISSKETTISMNHLMQFDSELVIQYLKERGMTACPILK